MARRLLQLTAALFCLATAFHPMPAGASSSPGDTTQFTIATVSVGDEFFAYGQLTIDRLNGTKVYSLPTGHRYVSCYYSSWYFLRLLPSGYRRYDVIIWDACTNQQLYPGQNSHCTVGQDYGGDTSPSECVDLPPRTVPAGYGPLDCGALAETSSHLETAVTPQTFDLTSGANLTATTAFDKDFASSLSDGTCTSVLNWSAVAWHLKWTDGAVTAQAGSGHSGITSSHQILPAPGSSGTQVSAVEAIAHVHVQGTGVGFDAAGNPTPIPVDAFVDVSNVASSSGSGSGPTYTPPIIAVGGISQSQMGNGSFSTLNPSATPATHLATIRGHLLFIYPRVVVVSPGTEVVSGVVVGVSATTTVRWTFTGRATDAPPGEGTTPGSSGEPSQSINVQWNNAEPIDTEGRPLDERVPITLIAKTTYPDGYTTTQSFSGSITVTIYYVASTSQS